MDLNSVGTAIRMRREALGLTQAKLAQMSGLSRQTLVGLENGSLSDLGFNRVAQVMAILGLDVTPPTKDAREKKRGLWMAAKTASVSYASELEPDTLGHALASGDAPPSFVAHLAHLLDEAPLPVIVMAVEEAASREHVATTARFDLKMDADEKAIVAKATERFRSPVTTEPGHANASQNPCEPARATTQGQRRGAVPRASG